MIIPKDFVIKTERLILRIPSVDDIPFIFSATRFAGFNDGMLWEPPETSEELLIPQENVIKSWENNSAYSFTMVNKHELSLIGRITFRKEPNDGIWNIGFWTHPEHQRKGYMTEATAAILQFGFQELNAEKIIANHAIWNKASEAVLKKNGMEFSKYIEQGFKKKDDWIAENQLEITKNNWKKNRYLIDNKSTE